MLKRLVIVFAFVLCVPVLSVEASILDDTIHIAEVKVLSPVSQKLVVGTKVQSLTPIQKQTSSIGSLTDIISRYSPIYIKTDAGGLASFRFRGTSSNHTSIFVGGIDINSLTLGSSNPNNVPVFLFDNIDISYGSSSAASGSGSIGGAVRLGFKEDWSEGLRGVVKVSNGSFGERMFGAKVGGSNGRIELVTRVVKYTNKNNFPFQNSSIYDFEKKSFLRDEQRASAIDNSHLIQQINYRAGASVLRGMVWVSENWHEAQPNMSENTSESLVPHPIEDRNVRTWLGYDYKRNGVHVNAGVGYVKDKTVDFDDEKQSIGTQRYISEVGICRVRQKVEFQSSIKYKRIIPQVYAYDEGITEEHVDLHFGVKYFLFNKLCASLNLRQQFVTAYEAPFVPAIGLELKVLSNENSTLKAIANCQRTYRIPTFNDRFWGQPGFSGNRNLMPEHGVTYEGGVKYLCVKDKKVLKTSLNYFKMDVDNWLLWKQGGVGWIADNVLEVDSRGVELQVNTSFPVGPMSWEFGGNYAYTNVVRKKSENITDKLDRQLEYVPRNMVSMFFVSKYKKYVFSLDSRYVGNRFYDQTSAALKYFNIVNASGFYSIKYHDQLMKIGFQINNLFSAQYQNQYRYAMPERSYRITLELNMNYK